MHRLERLYAINETIRRNALKPVSAARLADEFGVTRRTIERDLAALRSAGVPLFAESGRTGGQRTIEDPKQVVLTLSTSEVTALLVALASAGTSMPFSEAGQSAARRMLDVLADPTRIGVDELRAKVRTRADALGPVRRRIRNTLEEAVRRSLVVNLEYCDADGQSTSRAVEAVGFFNGTEGWFLIGWCRLREDRRLFRFDRITAARLTKQVFEARDVDETLGWLPGETAVP